ncbi:MAG: acyltransferase family protein [Muribaculaceae bacterium]|nr:acyltransferase family protein [Muribaculaceae bacterium]
MSNKPLSPISSISRGPRQSNFEALRLIAMLMVLILHADFLSFGEPTADSFRANPIGESARILFEAMSLCAVNVFIMISGWFGIRPSVKGFSSFIFQSLFFLLGSYLTLYALGLVDWSADNLAHIICPRSGAWFIIAYAMLYIVSPLLNTYLDSASEKQLRKLIIAFFAAQTLWGFADRGANFQGGYSTLSFCGLYLLAGYMRRYPSARLRGRGLALYACSVIVLSGLFILKVFKHFSTDLTSYTNPLIIMSAMGLIIKCSETEIGSHRLLNNIAASAFAVYLLHSNDFTLFAANTPLIQSSFANGGVAMVILAIIGVYTAAILLDRPRLWLWKRIQRLILPDSSSSK